VNFLLSGYYGYDNAGDEAVLAAILDDVSREAKNAGHDAAFTVTAGDPARTVAVHSSPNYRLSAVPRQSPKSLLPAIRNCDVFISGGGSLLQDVTSVRNVVYYTTLLHLARLARKPTMIYAQGVGPLNHALSQKLTRTVMQNASALTLRDAGSADLLRHIGVRRKIEVTADPVWALDCTTGDGTAPARSGPTWCVALRSWPSGTPGEATQRFNDTAQAIRDAADAAGARLRFLPMQPERDRPLMEAMCAGDDEIIETGGMHPRRIMAQAGRCDLMIAMRLHALIFAAAQGVPCVALNYDPKVAALAQLIGAPLIRDTGSGELGKLGEATATAAAPDAALLKDIKRKAVYNAQVAVGLGTAKL
jgi:polysaccharide pyruvyl transferase CsaB